MKIVEISRQLSDNSRSTVDIVEKLGTMASEMTA
jgi:hypothetical protein